MSLQFEAGEPTFFSEFTAARKIGETASQASKDKQGVLPQPKAA